MFLIPRISENYVDGIVETWFTMFMAATHNPTTDREVAVNASINPTIWTKSAVGGTYFRYESQYGCEVKYVLFPEVTIGGVTIPEMILKQEG